MVESVDFEKTYIEEVVNKIKINKKLKVVLDGGNGAAGFLADKMFNAIGLDVVSINKEPDGYFTNHHPDPSKEINLLELKHEINLLNADIGFAFDGDGDRIGLITNEGQSIVADQIIMLMAEFYLDKKRGPIVFDV